MVRLLPSRWPKGSQQTAVQLDQPTLEAIIEGVSQRILQASTSRAAEGESNEGERAQNTGKSYRQ